MAEERDEDIRNGDDDAADSKSEGQKSRRANNAQDLLTEEIVHRAQRANPLLRACLNGKILFVIEGTSDKYMIDWSGDRITAAATKESEADCTITLSEQNLMRVAAGDLNPQVAMLSDKIKVQGKLGLAIYVFNLIGARHFLH